MLCGEQGCELIHGGRGVKSEGLLYLSLLACFSPIGEQGIWDGCPITLGLMSDLRYPIKGPLSFVPDISEKLKIALSD